MDDADLVARRTNRRTGSTVAWYRQSPGRYALVCETHGHAVQADRYRVAEAWVTAPQTWCPGCSRL